VTAAAFDASVLVAALIRDHPEHEPARSLVQFLATGLADVAMICSAPTTVTVETIRRGADPDWARERARDVAAMVRLLDLNDQDATQALGHGEPSDAAPLLAAASFRRHGVELVVTAADRRRGYVDCGIASVLSITEADAQVEVLIPGP
jgi:predicted nucleic acid-binding protein